MTTLAEVRRRRLAAEAEEKRAELAGEACKLCGRAPGELEGAAAAVFFDVAGGRMCAPCWKKTGEGIAARERDDRTPLRPGAPPPAELEEPRANSPEDGYPGRPS